MLTWFTNMVETFLDGLCSKDCLPYDFFAEGPWEKYLKGLFREWIEDINYIFIISRGCFLYGCWQIRLKGLWIDNHVKMISMDINSQRQIIRADHISSDDCRDMLSWCFVITLIASVAFFFMNYFYMLSKLWLTCFL